jgi:hypothetical protein
VDVPPFRENGGVALQHRFGLRDERKLLVYHVQCRALLGLRDASAASRREALHVWDTNETPTRRSIHNLLKLRVFMTHRATTDLPKEETAG